MTQWEKHVISQLSKDGSETEIPAEGQILTESWNRAVAVPYIRYMPEKDRLIMLISVDYEGDPYLHDAMVLFSDDRGVTWSDPENLHTNAEGKSDTGMGYSLTYLGEGKLMVYTWHPHVRWFSYDYGKTWGDTVPFESPYPDRELYPWDPAMVDKDPETGKIVRIAETGYTVSEDRLTSQGHMRFSTDEGRTWSEAVTAPEWYGVNEIYPIRAQNGDIVVTCRTDPPEEYRKYKFDHYEGLGVSISKDNGYTWSKINQLHDWGRHHASLAMLPNNDILLTYTVRMGYPDTDDGYPQFGVEAAVSRDNGETWDLDHRYILAKWAGNRKNVSDPAKKLKAGAWMSGSQGTSTVVFPDGSILTAYGTAYRAEEKGWEPYYGPRDIGLVKWNIDSK